MPGAEVKVFKYAKKSQSTGQPHGWAGLFSLSVSGKKLKVTGLTFGTAWLRCCMVPALATGWSKGSRGFCSGGWDHTESSLSCHTSHKMYSCQSNAGHVSWLIGWNLGFCPGASLTAALEAQGQQPPAHFSPAGYDSEVPPDEPWVSCSLIQHSSAGTRVSGQAPPSNPENTRQHNFSL